MATATKTPTAPKAKTVKTAKSARLPKTMKLPESPDVAAPIEPIEPIDPPRPIAETATPAPPADSAIPQPAAPIRSRKRNAAAIPAAPAAPAPPIRGTKAPAVPKPPDLLVQCRRPAMLLKQVSDATRLAVLLMLAEKPCFVGEMCDAVGIAQPAISHHIANLRMSRLVVPTRDGKRSVYTLTAEGWELVGAVNSLVGRS